VGIAAAFAHACGQGAPDEGAGEHASAETEGGQGAPAPIDDDLGGGGAMPCFVDLLAQPPGDGEGECDLQEEDEAFAVQAWLPLAASTPASMRWAISSTTRTGLVR
jgi:hypothetical protein